jgi:hypothetical protein
LGPDFDAIWPDFAGRLFRVVPPGIPDHIRLARIPKKWIPVLRKECALVLVSPDRG